MNDTNTDDIERVETVQTPSGGVSRYYRCAVCGREFEPLDQELDEPTVCPWRPLHADK